jgi:hypothetical protein
MITLTPKQEKFVERLRREIEVGGGLEIIPADWSVGVPKTYSLMQRSYVVPRGGVEIDFFDDYLELEIDYPEASILATARFTLEEGQEYVTVELTLEEILEVWDA